MVRAASCIRPNELSCNASLTSPAWSQRSEPSYIWPKAIAWRL
uniref:Uncharacterized protein n=1 Tax=Anguilla anguilla TaxID=7936 RepID=A0A0E9R9D6_ANGAN